MADPLILPVQSLFPALHAPALPPPPQATISPPFHGGPPAAFTADCGRTGAAMCARMDRMLEARAISTIERLRNELGASDMALEAARSELHRERIAGALDRRSTAAEANAAAAQHAPSYDRFGRPVQATLAAAHANGLIAASGVDANAGVPLPHEPARSSETGVIVVRTRSLIDLFA